MKRIFINRDELPPPPAKRLFARHPVHDRLAFGLGLRVAFPALLEGVWVGHYSELKVNKRARLAVKRDHHDTGECVA